MKHWSPLDIKRASELKSVAQKPPLPAIAPLDRLQAGGFRRGSLIEISGATSSGRFAVALSALAAATSAGETASLIDLGDHLDPQAAQDAGVDLNRLLWVRPFKFKEVLIAAEMVTAAGFPVVVADLGIAPVSMRGISGASFFRLARAAEVYSAVLIFVTPYRLCGSAASVAAVLENSNPLWDGQGTGARLLAGISSEIVLHQKNRPTAEGLKLRLPNF